MTKPKPLRFQLPMRSLCMEDELYWTICKTICLLRQYLLLPNLTSKFRWLVQDLGNDQETGRRDMHKQTIDGLCFVPSLGFVTPALLKRRYRDGRVSMHEFLEIQVVSRECRAAVLQTRPCLSGESNTSTVTCMQYDRLWHARGREDAGWSCGSRNEVEESKVSAKAIMVYR